MKRFGRKVSTAVLTALMVVTALFSTAPMAVFAASTTKNMAHIKAGEGNGNDHFGGSKSEAFILSDKADVTNEDFSFEMKIGSAKDDTRLRFVTKYVDDSHWGYLAYDGLGNGNWFYEFKNGEAGGYPGFSGEALPALNQNDIVAFQGTYEEDGLHLSVHNKTTKEKATAIANEAGFLGLKDQKGKIGFGAASWGSSLTDIYFSDVNIGETAYGENDYQNWKLYRENQAGQTWEPKVETSIIDGEAEKPSTEGKVWLKLTGGKNNGGGHAYGDASKAAPILLLDNDKKMAGDALSLTLKPSDNWGVFLNYVDDNNWLYVGHDTSSKWYYQYSLNGNGSYPNISGLPEPVAGEAMNMTISLNRETLSVTVNGVTKNITDQSLIKFADQNNGKGRFGVKTNGGTSISFTDVTYGQTSCMKDNWVFAAEREGQKKEEITTKLVSVHGKVTDNITKAPIAGAKINLGISSARTDADGNYQLEKIEVGQYELAITKPGYQAYTQNVTLSETEDNVINAALSTKEQIDLSNYDTIGSDDMTAYIGKEFPYVARYVLGDNFFRGNEGSLSTIMINGKEITPEVSVTSREKDSQIYHMIIKDTEAKLDFTMDVALTVKDNTLEWKVTNISKEKDCAKIATISIPQLNLLSIDAADKNGNFAGANTSLTTTASGDSFIDFDNGFEPSNTSGYLYGFLTNEHYSAGLFSNSEAEGDKRVIRNNGADTIALTSAQWYYEAGDANGQKATNLKDYPTSELPCAKVAIAGDINEDHDIDWNDGALAYRSIMNVPYGSEDIKDMVNYRIVMNFASMASNPYMTTADNIKKVYLATDGLPQAVMLKGYGNEGHDSANSEYADIAEREGGVEDFQDLIKIAHEYNTEVGIHVNAQEAYPEAKSFNEEMLSQPFAGGWGWLDQSFVINKLWDLASQARWKRFVQLYDRINGTEFYSRQWPEAVENSKGEVKANKETIQKDAESRKDNMDFIYLDVWYQDAWETRQVAKEINSLGWRFSTEFSGQGEYDSTWQHWATDAAYGGNTSKGFNSDIIRFIRNDQRDSQVLNYPSYGGTADNPLLGGYRLYGFEGWGGDKDFNNYIEQTFNQNLPTKFLQHYYVTDWENYAEGESPVGNHEKSITLKNDAGDKVVVTRNETQRSDDNIERKITLNGREVLNDVTYLLPWSDEDGTEKLYHWNLDGGTTTWELPEDWKGHEVIMYELSDQGRINEKKLEASNGSVTLEAKAATAYVLSKGEKVLTLKQNFGEADHVVDPGFNSYASGEKLSSDVWSGDIDNASVQVEKASTGDQRLAFNNPEQKVNVTTTINDLEKGEDYVAEVYVENNSDAKAAISVNTGKTTVSNYTERSILKNYVKSDQKNDTMMQRMQLSFTAQSSTAQLSLSREAGEGASYMDDIRIVKKSLTNFQKDGSFHQDYETVVQGFYPFVLSSAQGINDPVTHLSQKNADYTDAGWNGRVIDDTIDGEWSLKHHGANTGIIYQTLPQNYRFEAGKAYTVEFDYQSGPDKAYAMVVGNGTEYNNPDDSQYLEQAHGDSKHVVMNLIGDDSGQTWIGLYENGGKAGKGSMGETDFVLDNLIIKENKDAIFASITETSLFKGETAKIKGSNLDKITWSSSDEKVAVVDTKAMNVKAISEGTAVITATLPDDTTMTFTITVTDKVVTPVPEEELGDLSVEANTEELTGEGAGSGVKDAVIDNDPDTYWHSNWSSGGFTVSEETPAILTINLGNEVSMNGFQFIQRPSGNENGLVHQFSYRILAADKKTVLAQGEHIQVPEEQRTNGATVGVPFDSKTRSADGDYVKASYIKLSIEKGYNDFAAVAEVAPIRLEKVTDEASINDATVKAGESVELKITHPENTFLKGIVWKSSDERVATVSQEGVVTGIKAGTATISISNAAGLYAESTITVTPSTAELEDQIKQAEAVDLSQFADGVEKSRFEKALANAKALLNGTYTQDDLDAAIKELKDAYNDLKPVAVDDKEAPSAPTNLKADNVETTSMELSWTASTDNVGVTGYAIYINGDLIDTIKGTKASISNLKADTAYTVEVKAIDAANNYSQGAKIEITTKKADQGGSVQPGEDQKPGEDTKPGGSENQDNQPNGNKPVIKPVDTGDTTNAYAMAMLLLVSGGILVLTLRRKKRNQA